MSGSGRERWVGLVRNVMLGREGLHRAVLLDLVVAAGGHDPRSYLVTGNVTFAAHVEAVPELVARLEDALAALLGRREAVVVRSRPWLRELIARDPFRAYPGESWHREVAFLPSAAGPLAKHQLQGTGSTVVVEVTPHEVLAVRPVGGPRGPHPNRLLERVSGCQATSRGWSTLVRLGRDERGG